MKASKKLLTILCSCFMAFGLAGGVATSVNIGANVAYAQEQAKNEAFIKKVKKFSTYSADVLDTYLMPIWNTDEVVDESATVVGKSGFTRLLYAPIEGSVVIRDYHNEKYYVEYIDFTVDYTTGDIYRIPGGDLPYFELNEYLDISAGEHNIPLDPQSPSRFNDTALSNLVVFTPEGLPSSYSQIHYYPDGQRLEHHFNVSYRVNMTLGATAEARWGANFVNTAVTNLESAYTPTSKASTYEGLIKKLYANESATVMFYGDSITYGCDATGHSSGGNVNPGLPRWSELVCEFLEREYGSNIKYLNGAVGGWSAFDGVEYWDDGLGESGQAYGAQMAWAGTYPAKYLADNGADSIDLMVLGFGMNDATSNASGYHVGKQSDKDAGIAEYKKNIRILINKYLGLTYESDTTNCTPDTGAVAKNPNGAIVLMSHMMPNTQSAWYTGTETIPSLHQHTEQALYEVAKEYADMGYSIAVAPVSSVFKTFEEKGKFTRNVLANNINHPTDFAIRVYAQTVLQTLTGYANDTETFGDTVVGNNKVYIGEGASVRMNMMGYGSDTSFKAGIRFRAYVNDDFFKNGVFDSENYEAGMWVAEEYILNLTGAELNQKTDETISNSLYEQFYKAQIKAGKQEAEAKEYATNTVKAVLAQGGVDTDGDGVKDSFITTIPTEIWDDRENGSVYGYHSFNSAVININKSAFATNLVARAYVKDKNTGTYYVSRGMQTRNLSQVSSLALATETNLTPDQTKLLQWFIETALAKTGDTISDKFVYNTYTDATFEDPNKGDPSTIINLTKGDYLQFYVATQQGKAPSGILPTVLVVDTANRKLVPISQMYPGLVHYDEKTGKLTIIDNPSKATISFKAFVTLYSAEKLVADKGDAVFGAETINDSHTKTITVAMYNSEFVMPANGATYKSAQSITFSMPYTKFTQVKYYAYFSSGWVKDANGNFAEQPAFGTLTVDRDAGTMTLTATSGVLLGRYTFYATLTSAWGGHHSVAQKTFTINVVSEKQYQVNNGGASYEQIQDFIGAGKGYKWYCGNDDCRARHDSVAFTERQVELVNGAGNGLCPLCGEYSLVDCSAYMTDYYWYEEEEGAYHYQSVDAHISDNMAPSNLGLDSSTMDIVRMKHNSETMTNYMQTGFTETRPDGNGVATYQNKYEYFLFDIKFTYANGTVKDGLTYDNTLAFWTKPQSLMNSADMADGVKWLTTARENPGRVYMFDANDPKATSVSHAEIVAGKWYTIAMKDPVAYKVWVNYAAGENEAFPHGFTGYEEVFAMFCAHTEHENATGIGSDFYFKNFRFSNIIGTDLSKATSGASAEFINPNSTTTVTWNDGGYWQYATKHGMNAQLKHAGGEYTLDGDSVYDGGLHAVAMEGALLDVYNQNCHSYEYLAFDVYIPSALNNTVPNFMFNTGTSIVCDGIYHSALTETDKVATSVVHCKYKNGNMSLADTTDLQKDTWYTYVILNPKQLSNWFFGVITPSGITIENHTVYFKNVRFLDSIATKYAESYSSSDWDAESDLILSDMKVEGNYEQEDRGSNSGLPYSTTDFDATFTANPIATFTTTTGGTPDYATWFYTDGAHKYNTKPKSVCNYMTKDADDSVLTQFKFTNYGYTYSDRILFDTPIHVSQLSSITFRVYTVLSENIAYPYDTRYGGIRIMPYKHIPNTTEVYPTSNNDTTIEYKYTNTTRTQYINGVQFGEPVQSGYMIPAEIKQATWADLTFDPNLLADSDGWIYGFWVAQSACASENSITDSFIDKTPNDDGCAYMNIDRVTATKKTDGNGYSKTILCDMHSENNHANQTSADNGGVNPEAIHPWPTSNADCVIEDAPTISGYTSVDDIYSQSNAYTLGASDRSLMQFAFGGGNKVYNRIKFNEEICASNVETVYLRLYVNSLTADTLRIHAYDSNEVTTGAVINPSGSSWVEVAINKSAIKDADGFIRGFWLSSTQSDKNGYINFDNISITSDIVVSSDQSEDINGAYLFSTARGDGSYEYDSVDEVSYTRTVRESHRYRLSAGSDGIMSKITAQYQSFDYISLDVYMTEYKNNLIIAQGIPYSNEMYYGLKGGFKIDGQVVGQALIYERAMMNSAYKKTVAYEDMQAYVWYTILVPIEHDVCKQSNYVISMFTYAGDTTEATASCTAYLHNFTLTNAQDFIAIGDDGTDKFDRFVSPNLSYVQYADFGGVIGKAYKLNADGYIGLTEETKSQIKPKLYSRMTMEFYFEKFDEDDNIIFWNRTGMGIGVREKYDNGMMAVDDTLVIYDVNGNRVAVSDVRAGQWYTVEIINPQLDWAFLGSTGTEIYFRNMIWHRGDLRDKGTGVPGVKVENPFDINDFDNVDILNDPTEEDIY